MNRKIFSIMTVIVFFALAMAVASASENSPSVEVECIGLNETINTESIDNGVLLDPDDSVPTNDSIVLFGHRTKHGGPFYELDEIKKVDVIILNWPKLGKFNYTVTDTTIMSGDADLDIDEKDSIYLITCDPVGSVENRLIIKAELTH